MRLTPEWTSGYAAHRIRWRIVTPPEDPMPSTAPGSMAHAGPFTGDPGEARCSGDHGPTVPNRARGTGHILCSPRSACDRRAGVSRGGAKNLSVGNLRL